MSSLLTHLPPYHPTHSTPHTPHSDFWTTRCTRCPDALDKLDKLTVSETHKDVNIISVCLGAADQTGCDPAREILEANNEPRWSNLQHYFAGVEEKEKAKAHYGFNQVPFYVVLNDKGEVVQKGSAKKVDLDAAPGAIRIVEEEEDQEEKKEDRVLDFDDDF